MVPLHRLFAFLLIRQLMGHYAENRIREVGGAEEEKPAPKFHEHLLQKDIFGSIDELQSTIELALISAAKQMGFIAEI